MRALFVVTLLGLAAPAAADDAAGTWIVMPDLGGKTFEEAQAVARSAGFTSPIESKGVPCSPDPGTAEGRVECQDPAPGERVRSYRLVRVSIHHADKHPHALVASQLEELRGLTLAEAKARLEPLGWTGKFVVFYADPYIQRCKLDTICSVGSSGLDIHDDIPVTMNKRSKISAPPP